MSAIVTLMGKLSREEESGKWTWKGAWAFGSQDPVLQAPPTTGTTPPPRSNAPSALPFTYTFENVVDASATPIPSLQPEDDDDQFFTLPDNSPTSSTTPTAANPAESSDGVETKPDDDAMELNDTPKTPAVSETNQTSEKASQSAETKTLGATPPPPSTTHSKKEESAAPTATTASTATVAAVDLEIAAQPTTSSTTAMDTTQADKNNTASSVPKEAASTSATTTTTPKKPKGPTFGDDGFVDACTEHTKDCPKSGRWKGSFQAAIPGSGSGRPKGPSDIAEYFDLFLYLRPPPDAMLHFPESTPPPSVVDNANESNEDKATLSLPSQCVYVRGAGANQFGIFELVGTFDRQTQVLRVQRLYVRFPLEQQPKKRGRRSKTSVTETTRSTTRKRQLSWKRKEAMETPVTLPGLSTGSSSITPNSSGGTTSTITPRRTMPTDSRPKAKRPRIDSTITPPRAPVTSVTAVPHGSTVVRLPVESEPSAARWRAAHFFHYLPVPKEIGGGGTPTSSSTTDPKAVVYEGELLEGQRDGRGVCVYHDNRIYQGEWLRDKEHGFGTLWTPDKKRIIYQGEWERGRIHGRGKYYYYGDDQVDSNRGPQRTARYEGEFRENLRHGSGLYVLPNGSTYDGQWQNGAMNGRGVFTWPDGSVYDGDWKDNRRNGNGLLKASDSFVYEGSWVNNTMEGRGSATYPDGQEYHGMWSNGRREGRGTVKFPNGAIYEGRFRDDAVDGQGTMKIRKAVLIPTSPLEEEELEETGNAGTENNDDGTKSETKCDTKSDTFEENLGSDFMIPISFQSDMGHIHRKAGFTLGGI